MRLFPVIILLSILYSSCTKDNKIDTAEKSLIWPLKIGNSWHYKGVSGFSDGGSHDTTDMVMEIDSMILIAANEYFSVKGDYSKWYRSAKGEVWQADQVGNITPLARNTGGQVVIHQESGTYNYFVAATSFNGTMTRIANSQIVVIGEFNCTSTEEIYKDETGAIVQKKTVYYSPNKGPICFKYYANRETPGHTNIYLVLQYTVDDITIL